MGFEVCWVRGFFLGSGIWGVFGRGGVDVDVGYLG